MLLFPSVYRFPWDASLYHSRMMQPEDGVERGGCGTTHVTSMSHVTMNSVVDVLETPPITPTISLLGVKLWREKVGAHGAVVLVCGENPENPFAQVLSFTHVRTLLESVQQFLHLVFQATRGGFSIVTVGPS